MTGLDSAAARRAGSLVLGTDRLRAVVLGALLALTVAGSAAGLFVVDPTIRIGPGMLPGDLLRLAHVLALIGGLGYAAFRYASKHNGFVDELALLLFLTCGVNLIVQLTGGARSYWQGLYLVLGGLASVAFPKRLVVAMVATVLALEAGNWWVHPDSTLVDLLRLAFLFLVAVLGYNYMERAERERAEWAEDRLLRLNAGLRQLADDGEEPERESVSPLSEAGRRAGRAEQLERLDHRLGPLLALAEKATGAQAATLLQVAENETSFWVRLSSRGESARDRGRFPLRGHFLAEVLRAERAVALTKLRQGVRVPWRDGEVHPSSVLAVPIRQWKEPPWILVLEHDKPDFFDEGRRAMAQSVADQMSELQSIFRQQTRQYVEELELKSLLKASERLSSLARLADLIENVVDYAREVAHFDTCAVCLREEGRESFVVAVAEGYRQALLGRRFPLESPTWAGWVLRSREEPLAIRIERRSGMPILDPKERPTTGASFLAVPLRAQKEVTGALFLTRKGDAFTPRELRLLRIYSNQAAAAIENAIVYERLENLAATDALTRLFNRRYFDGALARELARADRASSSLALLLLDIDHFKRFNDTYGHAMGDVVLKKVAATLARALRKADVLARYGGEEFVVLLPQVSERGALDSAERIRLSVERAQIHPGGPRKRVTVSVGLALFPKDAASGAELLKAADKALYEAKAAGRNRVVVYHASTDPEEPPLEAALSQP